MKNDNDAQGRSTMRARRLAQLKFVTLPLADAGAGGGTGRGPLGLLVSTLLRVIVRR